MKGVGWGESVVLLIKLSSPTQITNQCLLVKDYMYFDFTGMLYMYMNLILSKFKGFKLDPSSAGIFFPNICLQVWDFLPKDRVLSHKLLLVTNDRVVSFVVSKAAFIMYGRGGEGGGR